MQISVDEFTTITQDKMGGYVHVTKVDVMGRVGHHAIKSPYDMWDIAIWLYHRKEGNSPMVQERFPDMSNEDREFLLTGITPAKWDEMFPKEDDE